MARTAKRARPYHVSPNSLLFFFFAPSLLLLLRRTRGWGQAGDFFRGAGSSSRGSLGLSNFALSLSLCFPSFCVFVNKKPAALFASPAGRRMVLASGRFYIPGAHFVLSAVRFCSPGSFCFSAPFFSLCVRVLRERFIPACVISVYIGRGYAGGKGCAGRRKWEAGGVPIYCSLLHAGPCRNSAPGMHFTTPPLLP